jgi:hypothetical protein
MQVMQELLKHNSTSMKTEVELFIIEETQELIYDNEKLDQWNKHVVELGLTGQTKIQKKDKSPIPFLHMKQTMVNVFLQLCPRRVNIKEYDKTPIPVEILDVAALSVKENYFNKIEIWYDDKTPDPACIGIVGKWVVYRKNYSHIGEFDTEAEALALKGHAEYHNHYFEEVGKYLLGKWADVKQSFEELAARAKSLFIASQKSAIESNIREEKRKLEDLETRADREFGFSGSDESAVDVPF